MMQGTYYWNGTAFPTIGGKPTLITRDAFSDCCCCACPDDRAACYQLKNYNDSDLTACDECDDSGNPAWDGVISVNTSGCSYVTEWSAGEKTINGKKLEAAQMGLSTDPCQYWLRIDCGTVAVTTVWRGVKTKAPGDSPAGVYTRASGCDATAALELEACP